MLNMQRIRPRWMALSVALLLCFSLVPGLFHPEPASAATQATYYVSPTGNDANAGTINAPFQTIERARDVVRTINANMTGDIYVYLRGGTYTLSQTIQFDERDSGTNGYDVVYSAYPGEKPIISGGTTVTGWTQGSNGIWHTTVAAGSDFRQIYVNGVRAYRARSSSTVTGTGWYLNPTTSNKDGIKVNSSNIGTYSNVSNMELVWTEGATQWREIHLPVDSIVSDGPSTSIINLKQPVFDNSHMGYDPADVNNNQNKFYPFYLENAIELLDSPGEWYLDKSTNTLYYMPRAEENITTAEVYVPKVEKLINLNGSSLSNKATHITFYGISFKYDNYTSPSVNGLLTTQSSAWYKPTDAGRSYNRTQVWSSARQTVAIENNKTYYFSGAAKLASGSDTAVMYLELLINGQYYYRQLAKGTINSTGYTTLSGQYAVVESGTITSANVYIQTTSSLADLYVDNFFCYEAANLLQNPGFETGTTDNWSGDDATISATTSDKLTGSYSLKVSNRNHNYSNARQSVTLNNFAQYYVTTWVKLGSGTGTAKLSAAIVSGGQTKYIQFGSAAVNSSGWTEVTGTYYFNEANPITSSIFYVETTNTTADLYLDGMVLTNSVPVIVTSADNLITNNSFDAGSTTGWYAKDSSLDLYVDRGVTDRLTVPGAVQINNASYIRFERCTFQHLGAGGINMTNVNNIDVIGNVFDDISDGGVVIGDSSQWALTPSNTTDQIPQNITIQNNVFNKTGAEYASAGPVFAYWVNGIDVSHNNVYNSPNTGLSVGYGWNFFAGSTATQNVTISYNKVFRTGLVNQDGGSIYTLYNMPNSQVTHNYIKDTGKSFGALYPDEASGNTDWSYNVLENTAEWLHNWTSINHDLTATNNYSNTSSYQNKGINTGSTVQQATVYSGYNRPSAAQTIVDQAGLQPAYQDLLAYDSMTNNSGFETGTASNWTSSASSIAIVSGGAHSGSYYGKVYNRTIFWSSARQSVNIVNHGSYEVTGWAKLASGTDTGVIWAEIVVGGNTYWRQLGSAAINSTGWTQINGQYTFNESGPITSAKVFIQTTNSTADLYIDDIVMKKDSDLIPNSGLETGTTQNWFATASTISAVSTDKASGNYSMKVSNRTYNWSSGRQTVKLNNFTTYNASASVKLGSGSDTVGIWAHINVNGTYYDRQLATGTANASGWVQLSGQYTFKESGKITSAEIYVATSTSTADLYTDDLQLFLSNEK